MKLLKSRNNLQKNNMIKTVCKGLILFVISMLFINLSAMAIDNNSNPESTKPILKSIPNDYSKHKFSLGLELFPYSYKEPNLMKMNGLFYGINGAYSFYLGKDYFLQLEARASGGKTKYSSNGTGSIGTKNPNKLLEARVLYNRHSQLNTNTDVHPFIGLGFRYKEDDSTGETTTTGHNGCLRKSNYYYVPVGLSIHYNLQQGWGLYISGEYDIFLGGKQVTYGAFERLKHSQSKGYGLRSEILLEKTFDNYIFSIGPYVNYWNIKDSAEVPVYCRLCGVNHYSKEPKNTTHETGVKIKFTF